MLSNPIIGLADITMAAGVPGRTLLEHFRRYKGISRMSYLGRARFDHVRQALHSAEPEENVTSIAMNLGFRHMGRFSVEYRRRFGKAHRKLSGGLAIFPSDLWPDMVRPYQTAAEPLAHILLKREMERPRYCRQMIKMRGLFLSLCLFLGAAVAEAGERPIVVELFTSEGCSSCPPADALLAEFARRPDLLALSFHVDYWDRLGWKDPFSSPAATERQERYAELLSLATVYTPQMVVDGRWQAVGSDHAEVQRALDAAGHGVAEVPVSLAIDGGLAKIKLGAAGDPVSGAVLLIGFDRRHVTAVQRGENSGRTLAHVDVVRGIEQVAQFRGQASVIEVPIHWSCDRLAAIVQAPDGAILGIAVGDAKSL